MVIQRWQSVFLFLASVMMIIFNFVPFASLVIETVDVTFTPMDALAYSMLNFLTAILLMLSIFLFKNTKRQKTVVLVSILLMFASVVSGGVIAYSNCMSVDWAGSVLLLVCSVVLSLAAYRRIVADEKLLKSYDRIR